MKNLRKIGLIITLIVILFGCEKAKDPAGLRNVAVIPVISNINPGIFDSKDLVNSYVQFDVALESGSTADNAVVEGSYNNNLARVKLTEITSFPATVNLISGDVIQKLGIVPSSVVNGDLFTMELVTTANGITTRSNAVVNVSVACAFENSLTVGSYHSVSLDWNSAGNVTITADVNDPYTVYVSGLEALEGQDEDKGPLVMHIDPSTFAVTADKTVLVSLATWGDHNITYSGSGTYNSCDGSYTMNFDISATEGSYGRFLFNITRN